MERRQHMDQEIASLPASLPLKPPAKKPWPVNVTEGLEQIIADFNTSLHLYCSGGDSPKLIPELKLGFDPETGLQRLTLTRLTAVLKDSDVIPPGVARLTNNAAGTAFVWEQQCAAERTETGS